MQMIMAHMDLPIPGSVLSAFVESLSPHGNPVRLVLLFPHFTVGQTETHRRLLSVLPDIPVNDRWSWGFEPRQSGYKACALLTQELCRPLAPTAVPLPHTARAGPLPASSDLGLGTPTASGKCLCL